MPGGRVYKERLKMRKIFVLLIILALIVSLAGCKGSGTLQTIDPPDGATDNPALTDDITQNPDNSDNAPDSTDVDVQSTGGRAADDANDNLPQNTSETPQTTSGMAEDMTPTP